MAGFPLLFSAGKPCTPATIAVSWCTGRPDYRSHRFNSLATRKKLVSSPVFSSIRPAGSTGEEENEELYRISLEILQSFVVGHAFKSIIDRWIYPTGRFDMLRDLRPSVDFYPLILSPTQTPLIYATNCAVLTGSIEILCYIMKRFTGKEDLKSRMVAGFGAGLLVSFVNGMRGFDVILAGFKFAVISFLIN